ncbi:putative bifunctional diguanylate cyclase/phosphodiesterase [Vibrio barjaei]|uniref:putative bifunctional diguanylate cyclase/phosphodiesterase n=1 Tax=Vibrio barjaei TaxID=1676683 RepID=UPI0007BC69DA|nr:GGDEF domain-containing phosphodiesterase [Vibrio barjaei]OIN23817.1 hypothetical protein AWH66_2001515 [Vibrio barjaei]
MIEKNNSGELTNKDIRKIQNLISLLDVPFTAWGYCICEGDRLPLKFITLSESSEKTDLKDFALNNASVPTSPAHYFTALVETLNLSASNLSVKHLAFYGKDKQQLGIAFIIGKPNTRITNTLNIIVTEIESLISTKSMHEELNMLKVCHRNELSNQKKHIDNLEQHLQHLKSENARLTRQMQYQLNHDSTTNMLNRLGLENAIKACFKSRTIIEGDAYLSVILLQITNGERIQARIGCDGFDTLLSLFEQKISKTTPHIHYYARISTTELALTTIVPSLDEHFLPNLCRQLSSVARKGLGFKDQEVHFHVFMGVANSYHTNNASQLINNAYQAAVSCKESGSLVNTYTEADHEEQKQFNQLEHYLLQAVRNDDLILHFQPKVDLSSEKWVGAEVLLRWKHPVLGDVSNEALIHMAEQNGLIVEVGYFVLRNAIDRASEWIEIAPNFVLSVNVSAKQICSPLFADRVLEMLTHNELPAKNLELELTESCLVSNFDVAYSNISQLKQSGVKFALDDFGTGYASFSYLRKLPFDSIKIDKEFLANVLYNPQDKTILRSIINVAKKLDKQVVVEGVETLAQHRFVCAEQCDIAQGFYYAKPMPRDIFESQLEKQYPPPKLYIIR